MQQTAALPPALFLFFPLLVPVLARWVTAMLSTGQCPAPVLTTSPHYFSTVLTLSPLAKEMMLEVMWIDVLRIAAWGRLWEDEQEPMSEKRDVGKGAHELAPAPNSPNNSVPLRGGNIRQG